MNFEMAAEMTNGRCATVITDDDVAVETSTHSTGRQLFLWVASSMVFS
jgi:dihydroxyacetone kinase-like protein